jgi:hypothetical protein
METLGRSDQREIASRLNILLVHLLKWRNQPKSRKPGWRSTISEQRARIADLLAESPSLGEYPAKVLPKEYARARFAAADETGLLQNAFPRTCPFAIDEILADDFWPEGGS